MLDNSRGVNSVIHFNTELTDITNTNLWCSSTCVWTEPNRYVAYLCDTAYDVICLHSRNVNTEEWLRKFFNFWSRIVASLTDMTDDDNCETPHDVLCRSSSRAESTDSDSSSSSVAPTDFQLSESFDGSVQGAVVSVALERCWLCLGSRRSFYCKQCIRTGDFVHSRPLQPFQPLRPLADLERWLLHSC